MSLFVRPFLDLFLIVIAKIVVLIRVDWCCNFCYTEHSFFSVVFHRIPEWLSLKGISGGYLVQWPCSKQCHVGLVARTMCLEYLHGWRLHNFSGQLCQCSSHSHNEKVFSDVQTELPVSSLFSLPLVLSLGTAEKGLALSSTCPLFRYL